MPTAAGSAWNRRGSAQSDARQAHGTHRAVASGPLDQVSKWHAAVPDRIIPAVRSMITTDKSLMCFAAYLGKEDWRSSRRSAPSTMGSAPQRVAGALLRLAEELDIPVGIHLGEGPPGASYRGYPSYRARLTSAFVLEDVLIRHPRLRVYAMHYGSPLVEDMILMLVAHPQLYVDVAGNNWMLPRRQFHDHLLVACGGRIRQADHVRIRCDDLAGNHRRRYPDH